MNNRVRRFDQVEIKGKAERTPEGYIRADAIVTRTGIFKYANPDGTIRNELRHPDDVFASDSLQTLKSIPVTLDHPDSVFVTADNAKELSVGMTGENVHPDGKYLLCTLTITAKDAVEAIENGVRELSMGYFVDLMDENGTYDGEEYQYRQKNIDYNHLAIVVKARAGSAARLNLDSTDAIQTNREGERMPNLTKITLDGIQYEASQEVINALQKVKDEAEKLRSIIDNLKTVKLEGGIEGKAESPILDAVEKLKGERDSLKQKLDETEKKINGDAINEAAKVRMKIINAGNAILDGETVKKLDEMSNIDIMKQIILACSPKEKQDGLKAVLDKASEAYIQARFDAIVEDLPDRKTNALANQRAISTDQSGHDDKDQSIESSRTKYVDRLVNSWKPQKKAS